MLITNEDNMELMARYEDNHFDLAIVDPPYGIDVTKMTLGNGKKKINRGANDFSDGELAYTSFNRALRKYKVSWVGANANNGTPRIHPTEKPIKLYEWLLMNYAKEGYKILDTHLGSGSIALACHNLGFDLTACELDKEYYDAAMRRITEHKQQLRMF